MADITEIFWPLVKNLLQMKQLALKDTSEFKLMQEYVSAGIRLRMHIDAIGDADLIQHFELSRIHGTMVQRPYVYFDDINVVFTALQYFYENMENSRADTLRLALEIIKGRMIMEHVTDSFEKKLSLK